jgi:hypothetical protein
MYCLLLLQLLSSPQTSFEWEKKYNVVTSLSNRHSSFLNGSAHLILPNGYVKLDEFHVKNVNDSSLYVLFTYRKDVTYESIIPRPLDQRLTGDSTRVIWLDINGSPAFIKRENVIWFPDEQELRREEYSYSMYLYRYDGYIVISRSGIIIKEYSKGIEQDHIRELLTVFLN